MRTRPGFTLIEIILAMSILAFVGVMFLSALTYTATSWIAAAESVELAQKARLGLTRIFVELQELRGMDASQRASNDGDNFYFLDVDGQALALRHVGGTILLGGRVLLDGVAADGDILTYSRADGSAWNPVSGDLTDLYEIGVSVVFDSQYLDAQRAFTTTVNPLYTGVARAPRLQ
jgi:prepilin-type N-terminal cleavage/methylation domain-containing protein